MAIAIQTPAQIQPTDRPLLDLRDDEPADAHSRAVHEHSRAVVLEYVFCGEMGYMASLITASFHGKHYGQEYHGGAYRRAVTIQTFREHGPAGMVTLGWDAAKALAAAIAAWEQEHPDTPRAADDDEPPF